MDRSGKCVWVSGWLGPVSPFRKTSAPFLVIFGFFNRGSTNHPTGDNQQSNRHRGSDFTALTDGSKWISGNQRPTRSNYGTFVHTEQ